MSDFKVTNGVLEKYYGCEANIAIPDGVKYIGEESFAGCEFIVSVTIPESVVEIRDNAFSGCMQLEKINFAPKGNLTVIGEGAFGSCSIKELKFPSSLRQIREEAFCPAADLVKLELNDGLQCIGKSAFEACEDLPEVFIPVSVTRIDKLAFAYASRMIAYAEALSKPIGWNEDWSDDECPCRVVWGCKKPR